MMMQYQCPDRSIRHIGVCVELHSNRRIGKHKIICAVAIGVDEDFELHIGRQRRRPAAARGNGEEEGRGRDRSGCAEVTEVSEVETGAVRTRVSGAIGDDTITRCRAGDVCAMIGRVEVGIARCGIRIGMRNARRQRRRSQ